MPKKSCWSVRVISPRPPLPTGTRSTLRIGVSFQLGRFFGIFGGASFNAHVTRLEDDGGNPVEVLLVERDGAYHVASVERQVGFRLRLLASSPDPARAVQAYDLAVEPAETRDQVLGVLVLDLEELPIVHERRDHVVHVVGLLELVRYQVGEAPDFACRIVGAVPGAGLLATVLRQVVE